MAHKNADWEALFYALRACSNKVTEESGFMEDEECSAYADKCAKDIYEMALECRNHRTPVNSSRKITSAEEDTHPEFRKLNDDEFNKLKGPVEDALDELMLKKHFGLDKDVYDETVKYIIEMFGEDSLKPSDAKAAVADWYNDTKQFFPEMFGKGEKRKIASAAYLKKIRSSRCIKSSRKSIKSSTYQFVAEFDGQYQPRVIDYMYKAGSPSWTDCNEDCSNGKQFSEEEMPKIAKQLEKFYSENAQSGMSDIEIVRDNGDSVFLEEFLQEGSFDKAWEEAVKNDDKWFED